MSISKSLLLLDDSPTHMLLLPPLFTITDPHKPVPSASAVSPSWSDFGPLACSSEYHSHLGSALLLSTSNLVTMWSERNWSVLWNAILLGEELCPPLVVFLSDTLLFSACLACRYITPITYRELWCLEADALVAGWAYGVGAAGMWHFQVRVSPWHGS